MPFQIPQLKGISKLGRRNQNSSNVPSLLILILTPFCSGEGARRFLLERRKLCQGQRLRLPARLDCARLQAGAPAEGAKGQRQRASEEQVGKLSRRHPQERRQKQKAEQELTIVDNESSKSYFFVENFATIDQKPFQF